VDEMNLNAKPKRVRVLRATDVIPPFDKDIPPVDGGEVDAEQPGSVPAELTEAGNSAGNDDAGGVRLTDDVVSKAGQLLADPVEIPTYDLAENILAEQRRVASRRRRAPGRAQAGPVAPSEPARLKVSTAEPLPQDLPELQRIVAEIVARDIERLCRRPDRQLSV